MSDIKLPAELEGKYVLERELGSGTSARVFLARESQAGRRVALKVFAPEESADPAMVSDRRAQFINEAGLAGKLRHPHIVSIIEAMTAGESMCIVMEYLPGGDLRPFTRAGKLMAIADVIQIGFRCAGALDYAFRCGVIHRDLKPANILVNHGTDVRIADFGAALSGGHECSGPIVGTPHYMSPEQIRGGVLTLHSDMYAMGVVLYELLTGHKPFSGENIEELLNGILWAPPTPPGMLNPRVSEAVDTFVMRVLSKKPDDRFSTWAEFALAIAEVGKLRSGGHEREAAEKISFFRASDFLRHLDDEQIRELANAGVWSRVPAGQTVFREGETGNTLYMLASGELKVTKKGRLLDVLRNGECFGEMAYLGSSPALRHSSVQAITEALMVEYPVGAIEGLSVGTQLQFIRAVATMLAERLAMTGARLCS